jgi:two-component system phosphate regulon sensor histidine kinase PhoR
MDARMESPPVLSHASARSFIDHDELRSILSNLSHELCRPLISLRAGFDLLLGDTARPISPDQRGHVQTMVHLCDDLLRMTRSYLDYAGLVKGTRPLCYGSFTIGAMIREIDRQFAEQAAGRRITWECGLEGRDAHVTTDASRCQQIFGNLVANALKYTPEGGMVRVVARSEGVDWLVIVSDTGLGIPADSLAKVFEPFFRLARDEHSGVEGSGLGLAIGREMVDQMGGTILLSSTLGEGTRVTVRLPAIGR